MKNTVTYNYPIFLLADVSDFGYSENTEILSADGNIGFGYDEVLYLSRLESFLKDVAANLKADFIQPKARRFEGEFIQIFAESKRLEVGIDERGARPAIFVRAKNYGNQGQATECKIVRQVTKGFRCLIAAYPNLWSYPSSPFRAFNVGWINDNGKPVSHRPAVRGAFV